MRSEDSDYCEVARIGHFFYFLFVSYDFFACLIAAGFFTSLGFSCKR